MNTRDHEIERWLSERADGTLSAAQEATVRTAIDSDASLARDARQYRRLAELLRRWRAAPRIESIVPSVRNRIDEHVAYVLSQAADGTPDDESDRVLAERLLSSPRVREYVDALRSTDASLRHWRGTPPDVDLRVLGDRISAAVRREAAAQRRRRWLGWTAGLSAAAVILLVIGVWWREAGRSPTSPSGGAMVQVRVDAPSHPGRIAVKFDESPPQTARALTPATRSFGLAAGPGPRRSAASSDDDDNN